MRAKAADLEWLVRRRSDIQTLLLGVYSAIAKRRAPAWRLDALHLLLGAGFSLWRAVFLVEAKRPRVAKNRSARDFLRTLIEDNAINYPQDRRTRAWSGGYYLNNAYMRLRVLYDLIDMRRPKLKYQSEHRRWVERWSVNERRGRMPLDLWEAWDRAYQAADDLTQAISRDRKGGA